MRQPLEKVSGNCHARFYLYGEKITPVNKQQVNLIALDIPIKVWFQQSHPGHWSDSVAYSINGDKNPDRVIRQPPVVKCRLNFCKAKREQFHQGGASCQ
jgi:hypothetical protein